VSDAGDVGHLADDAGDLVSVRGAAVPGDETVNVVAAAFKVFVDEFAHARG